MANEVKKIAREFKGTVIKNAMTKTLVVAVIISKTVAKYPGKSYRVTRKYHVHDEKGLAAVGDTVTFCECRPLSKTKRWRLTAVLKNK